MTAHSPNPGRPSHERRVRIGAFASAVGLGIGLASCRVDLGDDLPPPPPTVKLLPTEPTTTAPDRSTDSLPVAPGGTTTTLVEFDNGPITISGHVVGPDGPVAAATVRLERVIGTQTGSQDVVTGANGAFVVPLTHGGRMRVRAWRAPDLVQVTEQSLFVTAKTPIELQVLRHSGIRLLTSHSPSELVIGQQLNIAVLVANDLVTADGLATTVGLPNINVAMTQTGILRPSEPGPKLTDGSGMVTYNFTCDQLGPSAITFVLDTGESITVDPGPCVPVPTTPPPTTAAPSTLPSAPPLSVPVETALVANVPASSIP